MAQGNEIKELRDMISEISRKLDTVIMQPRPEWMTVAEYAQVSNVTSRTVRNWIDQGQLETYQHGSKTMVRLNPGALPIQPRSHCNKPKAG